MWRTAVKLYEEDFPCEIADLISKKSEKNLRNFFTFITFSMNEFLEMKKLVPGG